MFDFILGRKKPFENEDIESIVKETFIDLSDKEFEVSVSKVVFMSDSKKYIKVDIRSSKPMSLPMPISFNTSEIVDTLEFAIPYLKDFGLKLAFIEFSQSEWTHKKSMFSGMQRGTKKTMVYRNLRSFKKNPDKTSSIKVFFTSDDL